MSETLLQVTGLKKSYGDILAVDHIAMALKRGELVGFMGPNGAGKSTTLRMLAGFLKPDAGEVLINGIDVWQRPQAAQRCLGYLPEVTGVFGNLTVAEYLQFLCGVYQVSDAKRALATALDLTRIVQLQHRPMQELSKGQRQRALFAGALLHDPQVLILDEPTDGLDPNQKHEMRLVLKELAKHKAILVATHILEEAEAMCSRVMIMNRGKILTDMTPANLAAQGRGDIQVAFRVLTTNRDYRGK